MNKNPEFAEKLRQWRDTQNRWKDESQAELDRLQGLSDLFRAHASNPEDNPFSESIRKEIGRIDELTRSLTATDHLIGLADDDRLVDPKA